MKRILPKKMNVFMLLAGAAALSALAHVVDIATFKSAVAVETVQGKDANPPPLTKAEMERAVKETARAADEGKSDENKAAEPAAMPEHKGGEEKPAAAATHDEAAKGESVKAEDAKDEKVKDEKGKDEAKGKETEKGDENPAPPPNMPHAYSTSELEVLQSLSARRDALDAREKKLAEREALLKAAEGEVDKKVSELAKLKGEMETLLGQQEKAESGRIESLVKIYENMKPTEAARIFNTLDMNVLLSIAGRMSERKLSPVLAGMEPDKARDVTTRLAEQKKLPEKVDSTKK